MSEKKEIGNIGERLAAEFLQKKGYRVVAQKFRHRRGEIDLIVKRDNWVLFIEVKTRSSTHYGNPETFVLANQVRLIYETAEEWIYSNDWHGDIRFDVVSILLSENGEEPVIEHIEDAIN